MFLVGRAILTAARTPRTFTRVATIPTQPRPVPVLFRPPRAAFSTAAGLSKDDIRARVLDVLKSFEKVDPGKLQATSSFTDDLGLDSLDAVEVVMAVEEEFGIEIPDEEADEIKTVQQAIEYIAKTPEAR